MINNSLSKFDAIRLVRYKSVFIVFLLYLLEIFEAQGTGSFVVFLYTFVSIARSFSIISASKNLFGLISIANLMFGNGSWTPIN